VVAHGAPERSSTSEQHEGPRPAVSRFSQSRAVARHAQHPAVEPGSGLWMRTRRGSGRDGGGAPVQTAAAGSVAHGCPAGRHRSYLGRTSRARAFSTKSFRRVLIGPRAVPRNTGRRRRRQRDRPEAHPTLHAALIVAVVGRHATRSIRRSRCTAAAQTEERARSLGGRRPEQVAADGRSTSCQLRRGAMNGPRNTSTLGRAAPPGPNGGPPSARSR